ncbi:MAG: hypothetical protein KBD37_05505 [Burkholderiales bacterium]|nr:hypothetical protein [Burkholderiales bacterium]
MNANNPATLYPVLGTPLLYQVNADTIGKPVAIQNQSIHTLAVQATNFSGGTVTIEWSLDAVIWNPLLDNEAKPITFTQNGLKAGLTFNGIYLRTSLSGSTNPQNVTATIS